MLFGKNKGNSAKDNQAEQTVASQEQQSVVATTQSKKPNFFHRYGNTILQTAKQTAKNVKGGVDNTIKFAQKVSFVFTIIATLFFMVNTIFWVFNKWGDFGPLLWVMLGVNVAYIVTLAVLLVKHRKDKKQMAVDAKKLKVSMGILRALCDVMFIVISAIALFQNIALWRVEGGIFVLVAMILSGVLLFIKLLATLLKIIKLAISSHKLKKKQQKLNARKNEN